MNVAVILAGGKGIRTRLEIPKQFYEVSGKPVISYCLYTFLTYEEIDAVQIVADRMWHEYIMQHLFVLPCNEKFRGFSAPGENRQLSIYNALVDICGYASENDMVVIHDAARPCVSAAQIADCLKAVSGHDGTLPVLPMKDTVYLSEEGKVVSSLLDRGKVFAGQAPEVFLLGRYYEANRTLLPDKILEINGSAEPAVMAGMDIAMIPGDEGNFKITTAADLQHFKETVQKDGRMV
ncbi:MAG: 2-C-methyl-D-erythritol 4-phosphate cytidylyltransferase [Lachnospiraceae bacterium]|nr:2-C-methyl-D-erythritol 4-phosphate cytidylyltransferase [Lachnospiraceae bacterium]